MERLTKAQQTALDRLSLIKPQSAFQLGVRLQTLRVLIRLGLAKDVIPKGTALYHSNGLTHYRFVRLMKG